MKNQPPGPVEESRMRAQDSPQDGWVEDVVSAQRYGAGAAAQQAKREGYPQGKRKKGEGVEDRKEETTEGI
jgi:hypothetical protein